MCFPAPPSFSLSLFFSFFFSLRTPLQKSDIDVVACVLSLKKYEGDAMDLLNTIRYGTHSFNSDTTPKRVLDAMA